MREETQPADETLNIVQAKELKKSYWRIKSREEFIESLSEEDKTRLGGQSKLERQPTNRYFKKKLLSDIVMHSGHSTNAAEKENLLLFVHFLKGMFELLLLPRELNFLSCFVTAA